MALRPILLAAALLCAAVVAARGEVIKATATNCSDFAAAFGRLNDAYSAARTSAPITLQLTLDCAGNFTCTSAGELGDFQASEANTTNGKQPAVKIVISSGTKCRKGDSRPLIDGTAQAIRSAYVFNADNSNYPETRVDVSISSIRAVGFPNGYFVSLVAWPNTRSTFTLKDVDVEQAGVYAGNADTASVTGGLFTNVTYLAVWMASIAKKVSVQNAVFRDNGISGIETSAGSLGIYTLGAKAKVSIANSQFINNGAAEEAKALYVEFTGEVSASLTRSTFANNTIGNAQYTACVHNTGNATRKASVSVAGSKGLDPAKPSSDRNAPWPTSAGCSVAAFTQA